VTVYSSMLSIQTMSDTETWLVNTGIDIFLETEGCEERSCYVRVNTIYEWSRMQVSMKKNVFLNCVTTYKVGTCSKSSGEYLCRIVGCWVCLNASLNSCKFGSCQVRQRCAVRGLDLNVCVCRPQMCCMPLPPPPLEFSRCSESNS
jgi:hypothetical protein